jgi:hypothetical protein
MWLVPFSFWHLMRRGISTVSPCRWMEETLPDSQAVALEPVEERQEA